MNYLEEAKELNVKYNNHIESEDWVSNFIVKYQAQALKAKIEAEGCDNGFQLTKDKTCACGYKLLNGDVWLCPNCQQALKELEEVIK